MKSETYKKGSLSLAGTIAMGTGVMIGAGIFALTGQVAQFSGPAFPLAFLLAAVVSGFSAYTYIKMSNKYPSAGGIAMILQKAYGPTTIAAASALLSSRRTAALALVGGAALSAALSQVAGKTSSDLALPREERRLSRKGFLLPPTPPLR